MRANEFIVELVTRAETTDHLIKRITFAAQLCQQMGDRPLLFREFKTGISRETVLAKVVNVDDKEGARSPKWVKGGVGRGVQLVILEKLGIQNPVFTKMKPPDSTFGFHGDPHIFIPLPNSKSVWSPDVVDLGGQRLASDPPVDPGQPISMDKLAPRADELAATYKQGIPKAFTNNEIIFDCEYYYLLNIQSFLNRFSGKENKNSLTPHSIWKKIDPAVWSERVKTYADVAKFLSNNGVSYVKWYQDNVENKAKTPSGF